MIAEFTVENFRSFKERQTFSMLAGTGKEMLDENTFVVKGKQRLLKSAVLYGANASGKSNFFTALAFFRWFAVYSGPRTQSGDKINIEHFVFSKQTEHQPSAFEMVFFMPNNDRKNIRYRYGFAVTHEKVVYEYLFAVNNTKEVLLFSRDEQNITTTDYFKEGAKIKNTVRSNCSFLSVCAQANGTIANLVVLYLRNLLITTGLKDISVLTKNGLDNGFEKELILNFLHYADIKINAIDKKSREVSVNELSLPLQAIMYDTHKPVSAVETTYYFGHDYYDNGKKCDTAFLAERHESSGTQKLFSYSVPVLTALSNGGVLLIDEFDAQLHPLIIENIVKLFNSSVTNPHNAQLVISCHAVNIMTNKIFRRDQIWFCEKDEEGATDLYSLVEYKEPVRKDASFNKNYLYGEYGAIPYINTLLLQLPKAKE
jgi:AAA15 family ATPase/GTPase